MNTSSTPQRVAVLLATYNGAKHLRAQLASILAQTHLDLMVFVRDDGSTDQTLQLVSEVMAQDTRVHHFAESGRQRIKSAASNFLSMACDLDLEGFDYVAFADQDDVWSPDKIERALELLRNEGAHGYSSNLLAFHEGRLAAWYIQKHHQQRRFDYMFQGASAGCTYVLSRQLVKALAEKVRPLLETLPRTNSHDWIVYAYARSHGLNWVHDRRANIFYRQHSSNAYGDQQGWAAVRRKFKLFRSRWYRDHIVWNQKILSGSTEEMNVLRRVQRFNLADRLWLASHAADFRREPRSAHALRALVLLGLL